MVTWDDYERHNFNLITANSCDFVVTGCPVSELKYKEIGLFSILYDIRVRRFFL